MCTTTGLPDAYDEGALSVGGQAVQGLSGATQSYAVFGTTLYFNANSSNTIYSDSVTTVTPLSLSTKFFIKY